MNARPWLAASLLAAALAGTPACAQTLYVATLRSAAATGASSGLYTVNLATGTATFQAPLRLNGAQPVGVQGIAVDPVTGAFHAITSLMSAAAPGSLVTVDPATGDVAAIAKLAEPGADIAFDAAGTLFMWLPVTHRLARLDALNGVVVPVGPAGREESVGGIAVDSRGTVYVTAGGADGTLDTVDSGSGAFRTGPRLQGAPLPRISAMAFSPSGLLLAVNSSAGSPAQARLVTINTATGQVATIGTLPDDTEALAFVPPSHDIQHMLRTMSGRTMALLALILGLVLALAGVALFKVLSRDDRRAPRRGSAS